MSDTAGPEYYGYAGFDTAIVEPLRILSAQQRDLPLAELTSRYAPYLQEMHTPDLHFLRVEPTTDYDESKCRVYFAPMGTPADSNKLVQALRWLPLADTAPLFIVGSPAGLGVKSQHLSFGERRTVKNGDLSPLTSPILRMLEKQRIDQVDLLGYSLGADLAMTAGKNAHYHGISVAKVVAAEPAAVAGRTKVELARSFMQAGAFLETAIARSENISQREAIIKSDIGMIRYLGGLLKPTIQAIAAGLTTPAFEAHAKEMAQNQPDSTVTLAWGHKSEISLDEKMVTISQELRHVFGARRYKELRIPGMVHADGDDISLHAAIMLQGLAN